MPAIKRLTLRGDIHRLVDCLRNGDPFYMASVTGGPITPDMNPSMGLQPASNALVTACLRGRVDYIVWSYATPIAWHFTTLDMWAVPTVRYSRTTSHHQSHIRYAISLLEG